jgi:ATPase family associated with various cellular activities (AAA)
MSAQPVLSTVGSEATPPVQARPSGALVEPWAHGLALVRELALLGAEAAVAEKDVAALDASVGFSYGAERFRELGVRMLAHAASDDPMIVRLRQRLGLSEEGAWLILLAAAVELFPEAAAALSILAEDERIHLVTPVAFAKLLRSALGVRFERALCEALGGGPAERLGLVERVEFGSPRPHTHAPLRLKPAEARCQLLGIVPIVEATPLAVALEPPARSLGLPEDLVRSARNILEEGGVLCVRAPASRVGRQLGIDIASLGGEPALIVVGGEEPPDPAEVGRLRGGLVVLDLFAACAGRSFPEAYVRNLAKHIPRLVVLVQQSAHTEPFATADLDDLDHAARRRVFAAEIGDGTTAAELGARFRVSLDEVRGAVRSARTQKRLAGGAGEPDATAIAAEILTQGARRMGRLVTHLKTAARLEDLIVPQGVRATLTDVMSFHRVGPRVYGEWRFAEKTPLGRGLSCMFSGSPGTGKTFAAQCLANGLGLNLYRIDLSQVVSKYIGETEKALARVFEEAEAGHGLLLFDEADALFGKRSEVKDAHDRYANVEVAYLLQRMESFAGISILTTNLRSNMDTAFLRRIRFIVEFPMPDASMRAQLWEKSLPPRERWDRALDLKPLIERFPLAGGHIHNIGVGATHLAAVEEDGLLRAEHLVRATYRELEKVGLGRSKDEFGPLAQHLVPRERI